MNNINTLSKQSSQISRASGVWGSMGAGKPLKTSQTHISSPQPNKNTREYSIGVPESQKNRVEDMLNSGLSDGPKPYDLLRVRGKSVASIKYTIEPASEGFFNIFFHNMDRETFYRVVSRLKQQGIETIGADTELSEEEIHNLSGFEDSSDPPLDQIGFKGVREDTIELNKKSMETLHKKGKMKKGDHTIKFIKEFIQREIKSLIKKTKPVKEGSIRQWTLGENGSNYMFLKIPQETDKFSPKEGENKIQFNRWLIDNKIDHDWLVDDEMDKSSHYLILSKISPQILKFLQFTFDAEIVKPNEDASL